jgi:hypothetical protein
MMVGFAAAAGGCVDAKSKFLEFDDRVGTIDANTIDRPPSQIYDISGTFLGAVDPSFDASNDPSTFVQFLITYSTLDAQPDGTALVDASLQPLRVWQANPDREIAKCPVGSTTPCPPLIDLDIAVSSNGIFEGRFTGKLPAEGNPVSGSELPLNAVISAQMISADFVCGSASGDVNDVNLDGSTFAAIRVAPGTTGANLPTPVFKCPDGPVLDAGVDAAVDAGIDAAVDAP